MPLKHVSSRDASHEWPSLNLHVRWRPWGSPSNNLFMRSRAFQASAVWRGPVHSSMPWYGFVAVSSASVVHLTISFQIQGGESAAEGAETSVDGQACRLSTHVAHSASKNCPPVRYRAASSLSHGSDALPGVLSSTSRNCERAFTCPPGDRPSASAYMWMPHALQLRDRHPSALWRLQVSVSPEHADRFLQAFACRQSAEESRVLRGHQSATSADMSA